MPMAVSADGGGVLCLSCYAPLKRPPTGFMPGPEAPEAKPLNDAELFCGGSCRADYFARRCSGSLRRQLGGRRRASDRKVDEEEIDVAREGTQVGRQTWLGVR